MSVLHLVKISERRSAVVPSFHPLNAALALSIASFVSSRPIRFTCAIMALPSSNCADDAPGSTTSNVSDPDTPSPKRVGSFNMEVIAGVAVEKAATTLLDILEAKQ